MIRVQAPNRLHFGLFSLPGEQDQPDFWPDADGNPTIPARHFGGVGLMVEKPGVQLTVAPADAWSAAGPSAERALAFGRRFCDSLHLRRQFAITVEHCAPEHVGLGTGTQLAMSVAFGITHIHTVETEHWHIDRMEHMAVHVGRGLRSALGVHGAASGWFLVEGGKAPGQAISPLIHRDRLPSDWRVLLIIPADLPRVHGTEERRAFARLAEAGPDLRLTDTLCRLVLLGMLPAIRQNDFAAFGEAVHDFNRRAGELFRPWQGGAYSHPRIAELIRICRSNGVRAVGQSSWGPTVFAILPSQADAVDRAEWLARRLGIPEREMIVTNPRNGITLEWLSLDTAQRDQRQPEQP